MGVRLRKRQKVVNVVRELDSFPKMPSDYRHYTGIGGLSKRIYNNYLQSNDDDATMMIDTNFISLSSVHFVGHRIATARND